MNNIKFVLYFILILYAVFLLDFILPIQLNQFGIVPRSFTGLRGIVFSPFLHGGWQHLVSNTLPLMVLLFLTIAFYSKLALRVIIFNILLSGFLTWIIGRPALHIGASGLIYAMASFLVAYGFMKKRMLPLIVSVAVALLYGGLVWGMLPTVAGYISWEGHLSGAIAGVITAYQLRNKAYE